MNQNESRISVQYNGNFSDRLAWNLHALEEFASTSRLDTSVVIKEGERNARNNTEQMGETLIWKAIKTPASLLSISPRSKRTVPFVEILPSALGGKVVQINHRVIMDDIQDRSKGAFEEDLFVSTVDKSVKSGLTLVLAQKKRDLASISVKTQALEAAAKSIEVIRTGMQIGILGGLSYLSYSLAKGDISNYLIQAGLQSEFPVSFIIRTGEIAIAFHTAIGSIRLAVDLRAVQLTRNYPHQLSDGPLTRAGDFMRGHRYLANSKLRTVELAKEEGSD